MNFLCANLSFIHGTMTASENLLHAAIAHSSGDLKQFFEQHLLEEMGHLAMLEKDLKNLGVTQITKFPEAAQLAGAQYYYIFHDHPALLLGYMAALECNSISLGRVAELEALYGVPLRCVRHHAVHDVAHGKMLRTYIEGIEPFLRRRVIANEVWTTQECHTRIASAILAVSHSFP